ncbi:MAG: D-3-phosphoglycerate dehydrogenase / 2-oxoglutarate reductase [Clostridiales bacterium]|jgi:D-3-phosphoglycerate dehydrogenase|nr:D-3-phosphoglycerate dehydrogenase / 2-oxoglutarate reductase [Clostridiales bacterium]
MFSKSEPFNVLIVGDDWVKTEHLEAEMKKVLDGYTYHLETYTLAMDKPMSREKNEAAEDITEFSGTPEEIIERIADVDVLITHTAAISKRVLDAAPRLKVIGCCRSDAVNINIPYATEKGIKLFNAPGRSVEPVSDITLTFALTLARSIVRADAYVKSGKWYQDVHSEPPYWDEFYTFRGPVIRGKRFGVVGLGKIGKRVAEKARAIGFETLVYDPFQSAEMLAKYGEKVDLETIFATSDFVTIHIPPTPENNNLVNRELLGKMKPSAFFINVARGEIVDEIALTDLLEEKKIAGAALDVYWQEPISPDNRLLKLDNVILTPHIAGQRYDVSEGSAEILREKMMPYFQENSLETCLNFK